MGAGNGNTVMAVDQGGKQLGAVPDSDAPPESFLQFAVVGWDRR